MPTAEELSARLDALTAEVARNDQKMRRLKRCELRLLEAEDLGGLFRELTAGLEDIYGLQYVSIVLCDPDHDVRHLLMAAGTPVDDSPTLVFADALAGLAPQYVALRQPWLGPYSACDHQLVFPGARGMQSVAMIPLRHRRNLVGSINFGSTDRDRFTRHHASDFLAHLGIIAGFCIENGVNRARLLRSGFTDVLTGWHNRRYLQVRLAEELARAAREHSNLVCLMLDIDHFKRVNDTWGHAAGDQVLSDLAQRIETEVRASDVAARYGGEEFVVLLPDTTLAAAEHLADRIRRSVGDPPVELPNGEQSTITVSIGIADTCPSPSVTDFKTLGDSLLARADVALYAAKSAGRNKVIVGAAA